VLGCSGAPPHDDRGRAAANPLGATCQCGVTEVVVLQLAPSRVGRNAQVTWCMGYAPVCSRGSMMAV
jgi:hypothetical protein